MSTFSTNRLLGTRNNITFHVLVHCKYIFHNKNEITGEWQVSGSKLDWHDDASDESLGTHYNHCNTAADCTLQAKLVPEIHNSSLDFLSPS